MADVVLEVGKPGAKACACIDVLRQGFCTPLCNIIEDELEEIIIARIVVHDRNVVVHENDIVYLENEND